MHRTTMITIAAVPLLAACGAPAQSDEVRVDLPDVAAIDSQGDRATTSFPADAAPTSDGAATLDAGSAADASRPADAGHDGASADGGVDAQAPTAEAGTGAEGGAPTVDARAPPSKDGGPPSLDSGTDVRSSAEAAPPEVRSDGGADPYVINGIHYNPVNYDGTFDDAGVLHKSTDVPCQPQATQCFRGVEYTDPKSMTLTTVTIPVVCSADGRHWQFNDAECVYPQCQVPGLTSARPIGDCIGSCSFEQTSKKWGCR